MAAAKYKLKLEQGATLRKSFSWKSGGTAVDLTGWAARMQMRQELTAEEVLAELTTENGGIIMGGEDGQFTLYMSADDTAALGFDSAVYDIELIAPDGDVTRILQGDVVLSLEVTR